MSELLQCPFCGGEAVLQKFNVSIPGRIICACSAEMRGYRGQPLSELIAAWNTRIEHVSDDGWEYDKYNVPATDENMAKFGWVRERTCKFTIEDNMNETEGMGDVWIECSACHCVFDYYADDWLMKMNYCPNCGARVVE